MTEEEFRNTKEYKKTFHCQLIELLRVLNELIDEVLKPFISVIKFLDRKIKCFMKKF